LRDNRLEILGVRHTGGLLTEALLTATADDAEAAYRDRNQELIEQLEAAGHDPVIKVLRLPSQTGTFSRTWMYCRRCGREADRVLFKRLTPSKPCAARRGEPQTG
jgi:hypothetical protein